MGRAHTVWILLGVLPVLAACAGASLGHGSATLTESHEVGAQPLAAEPGLGALLERLAAWQEDRRSDKQDTYRLDDPSAPLWSISARIAAADTVAFRLTRLHLASGGEGEARRIFLRVASQIADRGGYAGFDVLHYEEGIESMWPFAQRSASGAIRLVGSRQFPDLLVPATLSPVGAEAAMQ